MLHYNGLSEQCYDSEPVQRQFPEHADPVHFLAASTAADAFGTRSNSWPLAGLMTAAVVPPCTRAPLMSIEGRDEDILLKTRVDAARKRIASTALS